MGDPRYLAAERRKRWAAKQMRERPEWCRATRKRQDRAQRRRMIEFLGGECAICGCRNPDSLVIAQPPGAQMSGHQLYSFVLNEPDEARAELRLKCVCESVRLVGRVAKSDDGWSATARAVGARVEGSSRSEATAELARQVQAIVRKTYPRVTCRALDLGGGIESGAVLIHASDEVALLATKLYARRDRARACRRCKPLLSRRRLERAQRMLQDAELFAGCEQRALA